MTKDMRRIDEGRLPDHVVGAMRDLIAPPGGEGYWDGLESRIMAGIRGGAMAIDESWWSAMQGWTRPALVAAAALVLLASAAMLRSNEAERLVAYSNISATGGTPLEATVRPVSLGEREATISFLITR
jgi:hypothetical protein